MRSRSDEISLLLLEEQVSQFRFFFFFCSEYISVTDYRVRLKIETSVFGGIQTHKKYFGGKSIHGIVKTC